MDNTVRRPELDPLNLAEEIRIPPPSSLDGREGSYLEVLSLLRIPVQSLRPELIGFSLRMEGGQART
jgi:hypothetical protein